MLMPLQKRLDYTLPYLTQAPAPKRLVWWWCDALFMAPARSLCAHVGISDW